MKNFILALVLILSLPFSGWGQENQAPELEVTGIVVVHSESKLPSSAIVNDKIWWLGDTYLVEDGKLKYRIIPGGRVRVDETKLMKLVKVEKGKVTLEYRGVTIVKKLKSRA